MHEDLLGDKNISFFAGIKRARDLVDEILLKNGPPTSNSLRLTHVARPEISEVTSSEPADDSYGFPLTGALGTTDPVITLTSVLLDRLITSRVTSTFTSNKPNIVTVGLNLVLSRRLYASEEAFL